MRNTEYAIVLHWMAAVWLACVLVPAAGAAPPTLMVLDFDLLENDPDAARAAEHRHRLERVRTLFVEGMDAHGLYRVVDPAPARALLADLRRRQALMYRCIPCLLEVGAAAGAHLVAVGWVQKVSNLILNINIEIREVETDRVVLMKSVDIRGDTDRSWERGMRFMVRDIVERHQANPGYGR